MEVDARLILALAALAFGLGKAGPWILGLGLMRYGFVLAGLGCVPALARPLPPSTAAQRRLRPAGRVARPAARARRWCRRSSAALAAIAFAALAASFAVDVAWLLRRRR